MLSQTSPVVFEGSKAFGQKFILGAAIVRRGAEIDGHLGMNIKFSTKNYAKQFFCLFLLTSQVVAFILMKYSGNMK